MQDGTTLASTPFNVSTTIGLQNYPVDFHLLPDCSNSKEDCHAQGLYINDNGVDLDLDNKQNMYDLTYSHAQGTATPPKLELNLNQLKEATQYQSSMVNKNDLLGSIEIYNGKAMGLDATYTTSAKLRDGTEIPLADATYDSATDRLIKVAETSAVLDRLILAKIESVTLSRK